MDRNCADRIRRAFRQSRQSRVPRDSYGMEPKLNSTHNIHIIQAVIMCPVEDPLLSHRAKVMILTQHSLMCSVSSFAHEPEFFRALAQCSDSGADRVRTVLHGNLRWSRHMMLDFFTSTTSSAQWYVPSRTSVRTYSHISVILTPSFRWTSPHRSSHHIAR